ncbi:hypothetical protein GJ744_000033 [Endocarpon pusillum]|uniref:Major facilitator superfamily (MFS) profile domain-containing protein n=1 Tax=Endocarpon pusillum TaxID=364733 RepID=A0A8H7AS89_9EURO|nr:hypothetical protein GJ744_000033 [Endocarpon pusillum]
MGHPQEDFKPSSSHDPQEERRSQQDHPYKPRRLLSRVYVVAAVFLLFLNFFLAQYDKFVLSYFQADVISSLNLSSSDYGVLSGYATGIVYALLALPIAFVADYVKARVWVLSVAALWWSLCVLFQGLSHNFWQILLARIGMGIGQAPVEALGISLISDLVDAEWLFVAESLFYVGVYIGEAVSGQIATAFNKTGTPWNRALRAVGIVGMVLAVITRCILREPERRSAMIPPIQASDDSLFASPLRKNWKLAHAKRQIKASVSQIVRMRSFWLLTLSAGARQFSGNVFGYYMPSYLSSIYPSEMSLLSRYGIIVGVVGSVAVVAGGLLCTSSGKWRPYMPLYLTGVGGMISSIFVILMVFSRSLAGNDESKGVRILYGVMSAAYLTAELWLGAFASLLALLLPPQTKTFCLAIYTCTIILIYSSAPQMIGLALREYEPESSAYVQKTRHILAILIPVGYWVAGIGFLLCIHKVKRDLRGDMVKTGRTSRRRKAGFLGFAIALISLTVALFVTSLVLR